MKTIPFFLLFTGIAWLLLSAPVQAETTPGMALPVGVTSFQLIKTVAALCLVICVIFLLSRVFKPLVLNHKSSAGPLSVVAALPIGHKEKIVIVKAGESQFLLGVSPAGISTIEKLDQPLVESDVATVQSFKAQTVEHDRRQAQVIARTGISVAINLTILVLIALSAIASGDVHAQQSVSAVTMTSDDQGGQTWSVSVQILALMTVLTLLPSFLLMMTSFARITIVLAILRTALGTQQTPSNQIIIGLALFLTLFVMQPVFSVIYNSGISPWMEGTVDIEEAVRVSSVPIKEFMLNQTRETDIGLFLEIKGVDTVPDRDDISFFVLVPAFITSELKTAFQIAFILFIPFLVIDLVVASVLMSMGMMMLSPLIVSLPFKLMLFVLVDGWRLVLGTLAGSFYFS